MRDRLRFQAARLSGRATRKVVRVSGRGQGGSLPGRIALFVDRDFIRHASIGIDRPVVVTGTNGKTTTTAFVRQFLSEAGTVVANQGANMPGGVAGALLDARSRGAYGVFEVDESYVANVSSAIEASALLVLNLSRDQLDRSAEVRVIADKIAKARETVGLAIVNADDPMAVWAVRDFPRVLAVAGHQRPWKLDAGSCPKCGDEVVWEDDSWECQCGYGRPKPNYWVTSANEVACVDGSRFTLEGLIPGEFNAFNAAMAYVAVRENLGLIPTPFGFGELALGGRFGVWKLTKVWGRPTIKTYLAKNPAGWHSIFDVILEDNVEIVLLGLNNRVADGKDTSWIWDVDFEELRVNEVVVTGDRALDMALRCEAAGLSVVVEPDQLRAVRHAARLGGSIAYLGNYTAFTDLMSGAKALGALRVCGG